MVAVVMFELTAVCVEVRFSEGDWTNTKKKAALNVHGSVITVTMKLHMTASRHIRLFVPSFQFSVPIIVNERELSGVVWTIILSTALYRWSTVSLSHMAALQE